MMYRPDQYDPDPGLPPPDELQPGTPAYEAELEAYLEECGGAS